jgi:hypothetical protein
MDSGYACGWGNFLVLEGGGMDLVMEREEMNYREVYVALKSIFEIIKIWMVVILLAICFISISLPEVIGEKVAVAHRAYLVKMDAPKN